MSRVMLGHARKQNFPLRLYAAAFLISLLTSVFSGWQMWQMHHRVEALSDKRAALAENIGNIMLYDEVLTMSARMAAATGDFSYEKRYDEFDPQLTREINELRAVLPQAEIAQFVSVTDDANLALVKMERQAFGLAHQGRRQAATKLLISAEYLRLKKVYAGGMEKTVSAATNLVEREGRYLKFLSLWLVAASGMSVLVLLAAWFFAARSARSWAAERRETEDVLRKAHDELEVQVKQRTADLLSINEELQRDITQRKQMEDALRVSRENLHRLLNSIVEGAYGVDTNGNCTFVNRAFLQMLGYQNDGEVLGKNVHELIHHSHADGSPYPANECRTYDAFRLNKSINVSDEVFWRKDGVAIPVEYWAHTTVTGDVVTGAIITFIDITMRKRAEESLKNMAAKFHALFEQSADAIMLLDEKGFFDCNPATLLLFGHPTRADFISKHPAGFSPPTQPNGKDSLSLANEHIAMAVKNGSDLFEWMHRRLDGTDFPAEVLLTALELDGRPVLQATVRDINRRKQAEARLAEQLEELRRWHEITSGREGRILDLKHEVNELLGQAGNPPRYPSAESPDISQNQTRVS